MNKTPCTLCEKLPIKIKISEYEAVSIMGKDIPEIEINLSVNYCPNCGRKLVEVQDGK